MKKLVLIAILLPWLVFGQLGGRTVLVSNANYGVMYPTNFWPSNAAAIQGALLGVGFVAGAPYTFSNTNLSAGVVVTNGYNVLVGTNGIGSGDISTTSSNNLVSAWTSADAVVSNQFANGAYLSDFGGVGDGRKLNSISISSGVVTAPSGTFSASDTNKLFLAYLDSTNLTSTLTTIATYSNSTTVVLANTGITTSSKDAIFGTDNTTAMSNALASLRYSGGTVHIKKGVYLFGSSHRSASGANTTIRMPVVGYSTPTNETVTFNILGEHQPPMTYWVNSNGVPWYGTILMDVTAATANQTNAFFEDFTQADVFSPIRTRFQNLTFRATPNPKRTALYWKRGGGLHVQDCTFDADIPEGYIPNTVGEPIYYPPSVSGTTTTNNFQTNAFAIYGPEVYNSGDYRIRDTSVSFYGNAIYGQEHTFIDNVNLTANTVGVFLQAGSSSSCHIGKIFIFCNQYPIVVGAQSLLDQNQPVFLAAKSLGLENHDIYGSDGLGSLAGEVITDVSNRLRGVVDHVYGSANFTITNKTGLRYGVDVVPDLYTYPYEVSGSEVMVRREGPFASEHGAARFGEGLVVDVPFLRDSKSGTDYIWSRAPGGHRYLPAPAGPANWVTTNSQSGRSGVRMKNGASATFTTGISRPETNFWTYNVVFSSTNANSTNHLIPPSSLKLLSSTNRLEYHTGGGNWIYYTNNFHDGQWWMVSATFATNEAKLYVNGELVGTRTATLTKQLQELAEIGYNEFNQDLVMNRYQVWRRPMDATEIRGLAMQEGLWKPSGTVVYTNAGSSTFTNGVITLATNVFGGSSSSGLITNDLFMVKRNEASTQQIGDLWGHQGLVSVTGFSGFSYSESIPYGYKTNIVNVHYLTTNNAVHSWYIFKQKFFIQGDSRAGTDKGPQSASGAVALNTNYVVVSFTNTFTSVAATNRYHIGSVQNQTATATDRILYLHAESIWLP